MNKLENLLAKFAPQLKQDWKEKAINDLRGRSFEDIQIRKENLDVLDPLYTKEETVASQPIYWGKSDNNWQICESYILDSRKDPGQVNRHMLQGLASGVNSVLLRIENSELSVDKLNQLFEGIHTQMINLNLDLSLLAPNDLTSNSLKKWLLEDDRCAHFSGSLRETKTEIARYKESEHLSKRVIDLRNIDGHTAKLKSLKSELDQLLSSGTPKNGPFPMLLILTDCSGDFFFQIVEQRVMKLLVHKSAGDSGLQLLGFPEIEMHVACEKETAQAEARLIELSCKAMSAIMGGCDRLIISHEPGISVAEDEHTNRRIIRNIHHILKLESDMHVHPDPLAGSYWIEYCTKEMYLKVMKEL